MTNVTTDIKLYIGYEKCERFKERKRTCYMELYLNPGVC